MIMSAHMVTTAHIDLLLSAFMPKGTRPIIRWYDVNPAAGLPDECYQRGNWIGPGSIKFHQEHMRELTADTADRVGAMLLAENRRSVDHRYDESDIEDFYTFTRLEVPRIEVVLNAIRGYTYQSCEHPEWHTSEAHEIIEAMKNAAIARICHDDSTGWSVDEGEFPPDRSISLMDMVAKRRTN